MNALKILALALTALILIPSGAHLFELPGKIGLESEQYFVVQGIYAGWSLFRVPIFAALAVNLMLAVALRPTEPKAARWALASAVLIGISLVVFITWVFPANLATANWTLPSEGWEDLRRQWEYGHAVNAVIVFLAFIATSVAAVTPVRSGPEADRN